MTQAVGTTNRAGSPTRHRLHRHGLAALSLSLLGLAVSLTTAGIAGATAADKRHELTKKAYIKAADDICRHETSEIVALSERRQAEFGPDEEWTNEQLELFADEFVSIGYEAVDALRALHAPRGGAKHLKPLIAILDNSLDSIAADPTLLTEQFEAPNKADKKAETMARKKAREYGFKVCGNPAKS